MKCPCRLHYPWFVKRGMPMFAALPAPSGVVRGVAGRAKGKEVPVFVELPVATGVRVPWRGLSTVATRTWLPL